MSIYAAALGSLGGAALKVMSMPATDRQIAAAHPDTQSSLFKDHSYAIAPPPCTERLKDLSLTELAAEKQRLGDLDAAGRESLFDLGNRITKLRECQGCIDSKLFELKEAISGLKEDASKVKEIPSGSKGGTFGTAKALSIFGNLAVNTVSTSLIFGAANDLAGTLKELAEPSTLGKTGPFSMKNMRALPLPIKSAPLNRLVFATCFGMAYQDLSKHFDSSLTKLKNFH